MPEDNITIDNNLELQNLNIYSDRFFFDSFSTNYASTKLLKIMIFAIGSISGCSGAILGYPILEGRVAFPVDTMVSYAGYGALGGFVMGWVGGCLVAYKVADDKKTKAITLLAVVTLSTLEGAVFGIPMGALYSYVEG